jgi:hypothetical protein
MKIQIYTSSQIGLMFSWGINYEKRKYITFEFPFLIVQILWFKPQKK